MPGTNENNYNISRVWLNLLKQFIKIINCCILKNHKLKIQFNI